ncbi:hypothetical protein [Streptomyces sp. NPDC060022]|uniref:hypothetical protein n=1 Tax=Streptomyces sp. NPDC060022 TaxID=3347039 RepID=UPI003673A31A
MATRFGKRGYIYLGTVALAALMIWLRTAPHMIRETAPSGPTRGSPLRGRRRPLPRCPHGGGGVASWADLHLDPATGTAQIEDLITSEAHLRRGYADAVPTTALSLAADTADKDCGTRFLTADATDWPRHWYERRGFSVMGHSHCFERS